MQGAVGDFEAAALAAEAAANVTNAEEERAAIFECLRHQRLLEVAAAVVEVQRMGHTAPDQERLPLTDEDGYAWGELKYRIPESLFYGLQWQKDFGRDALHSDDGLKDLAKAYPFIKTKTVSGKTTVGWQPEARNIKPETRRRVSATFGPGTIQFAK